MTERIKLLFLTANPTDQEKLSTDPELRDITAEISASVDRDRFEIASAFAVRRDDLVGQLLRHSPTIVHFSGHGKNGQILLENERRKAVPVPGEALASLFENLRGTVEIVFLNACETHETAEAIQQVVDYTIAMSRPIADEAAVSFARAFYLALASGVETPRAFKLGITQLNLDGLTTEIDIPRLYSRAPGEPRAAVQQAKAGRIQSLVHLVKSTTGDIIVINGRSNVVRKD